MSRKLQVATLLLALSACSDPAPQQSAASALPQPAVAPDPALAQRVERLQKAVEYGEDVSALKKLQKSYGYYLDKGLWTDLAEFFADEARANYPAGVFVGKDSIREHLYRNVGGVDVGEVGLGDNRLYNHLNLQPVVHLDPSGGTAEGRWRAMAMLGRYGSSQATWAEGVYNMVYVKEGGVWKIWDLDYTAGFSDSYATGWGANPDAEPRPGQQYAHPADEERNAECNGFPQACYAPFHYGNPGTTDDSNVWVVPAELPLSDNTNYAERVGELQQRAQVLRDEQHIENLIRAYGYYVDRMDWSQVADLFTANGTVEYAQQGVYRGPERILAFLAARGPAQLADGVLNDHVQLQTVVSVAPDGQSARARSREWNMTGVYQQAGSGRWEDGLYENSFIKEDGVWKFATLHYYPTYISDYDKGWAADAQPAPGPLADLPPDAPPSDVYAIFPKAHVPPFHYRNPISGNEATYPELGGPSADSIAATLFTPPEFDAPPPSDVDVALANAETLIQQVKDHHEIENLENAYGYYLDKNLWNDLADLFAENGSMELAQRGVYIGRERVRQFLFEVFGAEGPVQGRLGNHVHMQPVITLDEGGQSGKVRARMMQQLSFNANPSMGAAVYENVVVKEDGKWKYASTHAFNTWTASYKGGWVQNPGNRVPGPSESFPPDAPPSFTFAMFPTVYPFPYHYANPVTGR
ncbi:MAG: hypothetical protein RLZZ227_957 [Pseudomonadota bacterium]